MRRWQNIALNSARWFFSVLAFVALALFVLLGTEPGLSALAWLIHPLSGGTARVQGLRGNIPDAFHADTVEISDAKGVWLRVENVSLDWSALAALRDHIAVRNVSAGRVVLLRFPEQDNSQGTTPRIDVDRLAVARIEIAKSAIGRAALLSAQGSLHYQSLHDAGADLAIARLDSADRYRVRGSVARDVANGTITISEGADGILAGLIGLPGLGPINMNAQASGGSARNLVAFDLSAGALRASGHGTISLARRSAAIDFFAHAPAMQPRADVSWQSLLLDGHINGSFDAPNVNAKLRIENARAMGGSATLVAADVAGGNGAADLSGSITGLHLPGDDANLFAAAPLTLKAHADLDAPKRPVAFALSHPLMTATGSVHTAGTQTLAAAITIPSLAPFSALANTELRGSARLNVRAQQNASVTALSISSSMRTEGSALVARLLGANATMVLRADIAGQDLIASSLTVHGAGLNADVKGTLRGNVLDYTAALGLPDMGRLTNTLHGDATLNAAISGPLKAANLQASGSANVANAGFARQRIGFTLSAKGLPDPASAQLRASGRLDGAAVSVTGDIIAREKSRNAKLTAAWKSLDAKADLLLPQKGAMTGQVRLSLKNLSDVAAFIGDKIDGALNAVMDIRNHGGKPLAAIKAHANDLRAGNAKAGVMTAEGTIDDPLGKPSLALNVKTQKLTVSSISGDASAVLKGPLGKLAVTLKSDLRDGAGNPAHVTAIAMVDTDKQKVSLQHFNGIWRDETLALRSPAIIDLADGIAVDKFAATLAGGDVVLSGRLTPKLATTLTAHGIPAMALTPFIPQLSANGTLSASAQLTGTLSAPQGTITLQGRGLSARGISAKAVAPADLDARGVLHGKDITLNATLAAGNSAHLTLTGDAPLAANTPMKLHLAGNADVAVLNPLLMAGGRQARGKLSLDMNVAGTFAAPRASGGGNLTGGELQDFTQGIHIRDIAATFQAQGNVIHITQLSAKAGHGTINGSGTIDLAASGIPIDIAIKANNARPIVSDKLTATLSGDMALKGKLEGNLNLSGKIRVVKGEINLPDKFPPDVAVLDVRRPGQAPPPPSISSAINLDVTVTAPEQIFVRGHGIDAEVSGRVQLSGTTGTPFIGGGFTMRRGTLSVAGQTLNFTSGKISFNGAGVRNKLDPTLDFEATTTSGGVTATLTVGGYASAPKITLSSSPQLPQDEVLAHLLFQQSVKQLSPLQLAEIAQALASLGGIGDGFSPLGALRKSLRLDRLSVGGAAGSDGETEVEAGKYVARNVYVGAKQNLSGGTQVQVQVDITRRLKAQATLSTATNATVTKGNAAQDNGSNVGLSYQFEY